MTNIILLICCILSGFALGCYLKRQVNDKFCFWQDACKYTKQMQINVDERRLDKHSFDECFVQNCSKSFAYYLSTGKLPSNLSKYKKTMANFANDLSVGTSAQLKQSLAQYHQTFENVLQFYLKDKQKSEVYPKLGILLGAIVGICLL